MDDETGSHFKSAGTCSTNHGSSNRLSHKCLRLPPSGRANTKSRGAGTVEQPTPQHRLVRYHAEYGDLTAWCLKAAGNNLLSGPVSPTAPVVHRNVTDGQFLEACRSTQLIE